MKQIQTKLLGREKRVPEIKASQHENEVNTTLTISGKTHLDITCTFYF